MDVFETSKTSLKDEQQSYYILLAEILSNEYLTFGKRKANIFQK